MTKTTPSPKADGLLVALNHPLRRQILRALNGQSVSPIQLSKTLGEPVTRLSYHVKVLSYHGALKLVRTRAVRGTVEHFYRSSAKTEAGWVQAALLASQSEDQRRR